MAPSKADPPSASPFEDRIDRFDAAWREGKSPKIQDFLPSPKASASGDYLRERRALLIELVKVDLEYRWRRAREGQAVEDVARSPAVDPAAGTVGGPNVDHYARVFPTLVDEGHLPVDLIGEEYRVRHRFGDRPSRDEYRLRFAPQIAAIDAELDSIEVELARESSCGLSDATVVMDTRASSHGTPRAGAAPEAHEPVDLGGFLSGLRESRILSDSQYEQAAAESRAAEPPTPQQLADQLVSRGWLTSFQARALRFGRLQDLQLGEYLILSKLGEGGMGIVYKARHRRMDRVVALKILDAKILNAPEALRRFRREVQAAARLNHPNIVLAYDASEDAGRHYLVMEYVEGTNMRRYVSQHGRLSLAEALDCIVQAARGLDYAHEQKIIHRDIKPDNLLRDASGRVRVLDLGLARLGDRAASAAATITASGSLMGTLEFMAPEQARDAHLADHRADIYSLGCTLYFLVNGRPPYGGDSMYEKLSAHQEDPIPPLVAAGSEDAGAADEAFRRMMAKQPDDRFQSMADVIEALSRVQHESKCAVELPTTDDASHEADAESAGGIRNAWRRWMRRS
ncbi:MAG: serine/threonine-protein kinase [Pirellulales bacterium]